MIERQHFPLLTKVQDAIRLFPSSQVRIEGNTDSFGTDDANLRLSNDRASAVRDFLIANMRESEARFSAVGYGETRPIANNDRADRRARNRRIDVVITPNQAAASGS